jgi:hypothetical protein
MLFFFTTQFTIPPFIPPSRSIETIVPSNPENSEDINKSMSISSFPEEE